MTKQINQHFFDEESKRRDYVYGASFGCYHPQAQKRMLFRSRYKDLVEIIKREMESEHKIISHPKRGSYWIEVSSAPYLYSKLEELGLNVPKSEREFPKKIEYMSHFVRGFLDAKSSIHTIEDKYTNIYIGLSKSFLLDLHKILVKYAKVEGKGPKGNQVVYCHNDSVKIHDFIYQDWDFIKESGLYLPSKKELFNLDYVAAGIGVIRTNEAKERVDKAKELLKTKKVKEVAKELGYAHQTGLNKIFKQITNQTPSEYKMKILNQNN